MVVIVHFLWNRRTSVLTLQCVGLPPYNRPELVTVQFDDGGGWRQATGHDLAANRPAARFPIRTHGRLAIRVVLGAADSLAALELPFDLRPDLLLDVVVYAGDADSILSVRETLGDAGQISVPIRARSQIAGRDSNVGSLEQEFHLTSSAFTQSRRSPVR